MRKTNRRSRILTSGLLLATALGLACASDGTPAPDSGPLAGAPDWVLQGCSAYWGDDETGRICGVGSVSGTRNISLARTAAMGRARTEIARSLEVKVKSMLKDYQSTTTGGGEFGDASTEEQNITDVSKQITQNTLNGTTLQDTWVASDGTLFTLVSMDADAFIASLSKMNNLNDEIRKAVEARAQASFKELDEATQ